MTVELRIVGREGALEVVAACQPRLVHHWPIQHQDLQKAREIRDGRIDHVQGDSPCARSYSDARKRPLNLRWLQLRAVFDDRQHISGHFAFLTMELEPE